MRLVRVYRLGGKSETRAGGSGKRIESSALVNSGF